MTMIRREDKENRQVLLTIRVEQDVWQQALDAAFENAKKLFEDCQTRSQLEAKHGADVLYQDAVNATFPAALTEAVNSQGLMVVGAPTLNITDIGPGGYLFTALITLYPEVKLGQYKGLKAVYPSVELSDDDTTAAMEEYCRAHTVSQNVDRAAMGDQVTMDFEGFVDGVPFEGGKAEQYPLVLGSGAFIPGFEEQVAGIRAGEERDIHVTFPTQYAPELAGKDASFHIRAHAIVRYTVPALDDEFAKAQGYADAAALRRSIMAQALEHKESEARGAFADKLMEQVIANMEVDLPDAMVEDQLTGLIGQLAAHIQSQGMELDQYLEMAGMTMDDLRARARAQAEYAARYELAMMEIIRRENITVTEADVEPEYERLSQQHGVPIQQIKKLMPVMRLIHETRLLRARAVVVDSAVRI